MGWKENFDFLNDALQSGYVGSAPRPTYQRPYRPRAGAAYDPWQVSPPSAPNWLEFASRPTSAGPQVSQGAFGGQRTYKPASAPERVSVSLGYSSTSAPPVQRSTKDDPLGSLGGAIGGVLGAINPLNAIPWLMERPAVFSKVVNDAANNLADATANVPVVGAATRAASVATGMTWATIDAFGEAVSVGADIATKPLTAFLDWQRDSSLNDRVTVYQAILNGEVLDPWKEATLSGNWIPFSTKGANTYYSEYMLYHKALVDSMDPSIRADAQKRMSILLDSFDLPTSVKAELLRNPRADGVKLLDEAPEGRQFSYDPGLTGIVSNLGPLLIVSLAGLKGIGTASKAVRLGGTAKAGTAVTWGDIGSAYAGGARGTAIAGGAIKAVSQSATIAGRLQSRALRSGATLTALTTGADAVYRWSGDEAVVDWFEKINRTAIISDKPSVQLLTSFTVNPFDGLKALKNGTLKLAHFASDITVGRLTGRRMAAYYSHNDLLNAQVARMYKLGSNDEAARFIDEHIGGRGAAFNQVVGTAAQTVAERLPVAERAVLSALPAAERADLVLSAHGGEVMRLLERDPELVAARWYNEFWLDRQMEGPFSPEVAALIGRDYAGGMAATYQARQRMGAVLGRADYLPPHGVTLAREWLDGVTDAAGNVPIQGVRGFQDLQRQFPAISKYRQGLITPGATSIPRSAIETMLERASGDFARVEKTNPVRAATATDPILRPDATPHEYAKALGTDVDTIKELSDFKPGAPVDRLRAFIVEKVGLDPAQVAQMPPEDVWSKASQYVDDTTIPWVEMGQRVATAQRQMLGVKAELARLRAQPQNARGSTYADRVAGFERQLAQLSDIVKYATDPPVPFSAFVKDARATGRSAAAVAHLEEMALRREQALDSLERLNAIEESPVVAIASSKGNVPWYDLVRPHPISGVTAWSGGATPMSAAFRRRFAAYLRSASDGGSSGMSRGRMDAQAIGLVTEMGDQEAWDLFRRHPQAMDRMTKSQQRTARAADSGIGIDEFSSGYHGREGMNPTDAFLEDLIDMAGARAELLNGRTVYNLTRTANMKAGNPIWWSEKAMIADPRSPTFDPGFVAIDHPHNIGRVKIILERPEELFPGLSDVVLNDPIMALEVGRMADEAGATIKQILDDPSNATVLREILVPEGWVPPAPGIQVTTPLDELIAAGDRPSIETMTEQLRAAQTGPVEPLTVPLSVAQRTARAGTARKSHDWRKSLVALGADFGASPNEAILLGAGNRMGLDVLSVINHGVPGRQPATVAGVLRALREIENGNAGRMGIGTGLQAEGQRVAQDILKAARDARKREGVPIEAFGKGTDPAMMAADDIELARELGKGGYLRYDESDPLGSLQYVFKKPPKNAVVLEWSQVPTLAEEFLTGRFEPFEVRLGTHQASRVASYLFGPHSNESIGAAVRNQFIDRLGKLGVEAKDAAAIWTRWRDVARDSRSSDVRTRTGRLTGGKVRDHFPGDGPLYADVRNIPSRKLDRDAQEALGLVDGLVGPAINHADYDPAYLERLRTIDYGTVFREASSPVRRYLKGESIQFGNSAPQISPFAKTPTLGRALASTYGLAVHNKAATTLYYWFRFALDVRYHAMNYFEAQILYLGRAGLKDGEIKTGMFGQSENYLRRLDEDFANNTGYATSRSRFAYMYRTFLKEQPDAMRGAVLDIERADPNLMSQALEEIAKNDGQIQDMIKNLDGADATPDQFLAALDEWHGKLLSTVDDADAAAAIDEAIAPALRETPALAEVYGRIGDVNKRLAQDIRETFYGNPDRSRMERMLNSYILFWPISYQIKATKWLLRVMYDRAGGIKTNAVGGYAVAEFAQTHQRLLATDPEYADWFEKHKTLVFMAQMLVPITPDSLGVSLNPILRDIFFERTKAPWEIGPIYTASLIPKLAKELDADLYPTLGQVPGFDGIYRMLTGRQAPQREGQPAKSTKLAAPDGPEPWTYKPLWEPDQPAPQRP